MKIISSGDSNYNLFFVEKFIIFVEQITRWQIVHNYSNLGNGIQTRNSLHFGRLFSLWIQRVWYRKSHWMHGNRVMVVLSGGTTHHPHRLFQWNGGIWVWRVFVVAELATRAAETERTSTAEGRGHLRQLISKTITQTVLLPSRKEIKYK